MTAHHAFLHCLLIKWCLTFQKTFLKEQWNKSASKQQNTRINPIPDWSHPIYVMAVGYSVLSPPLVFIALIQISEKYWLALHRNKNLNHMAKTLSVFPVSLIGVQVWDKVLSSPLLMVKKPAGPRGYTPSILEEYAYINQLQRMSTSFLKATSLKQDFKKRVLRRQGKSYRKTRLITIVSRHHVKNLQIKRSNSEEPTVFSQ